MVTQSTTDLLLPFLRQGCSGKEGGREDPLYDIVLEIILDPTYYITQHA